MPETVFTPELISTACVLLAALYLFVSERIPADLTALLIPVALGVLGVLQPGQALEGFGNPAVVTVAALFVLSKALVESGAVSALGAGLQRVAKGEKRGLLALILFAAVPSALINNTLVVVVFIPVVLQLAVDRGLAPSRLLLPLSYASILGGCCTAIGTSTTVLLSARLDEPLSFFEPARMGWVLLAVGVVYMMFASRLLPTRRTVTGMAAALPTEYVTEVQIVPGSPLAGKTLREAVFEPHPDVTVIEVVRGEEILWPEDGSLLLEERDLLFVRAEASAVFDIGSAVGAALLPELGGVTVRGRDVTLAELVIPRSSPLVGRTVREALTRAVPDAALMAVERQGAHLRTGLADIDVRAGDTLLIQTEAARLPSLRHSDDFVLLEALHEKLELQRRAPLVIALTVAMILIAAFEILDISFLSMGVAALIVLTRCLSPKQAYRSLDLSTLVLMGGSIALGTAMKESGLADLIAGGVQSACVALPAGKASAYGALGIVWLLTAILTLLISNVAAAVVVLPIALKVAELQGVADRPFILAIVYAASLAFASPVGYQTNLLVWNPGGYRFTDYIRFGGPLQIVLMIVGVALMPLFFPF